MYWWGEKTLNKTIRFRFRKGNEIRFLSHLDLIRTLERAIRRANLPIAYSEGFNPRPKMSFGFALAVGVLSEGEYGDYEFVEDLDPEEFVSRYNRVLPPGLQVFEAETLPPRTATLMSVINAATYQLIIPDQTSAEIVDRWSYLQKQDSFVVERQAKKGLRKVDVLPFLINVTAVEDLEAAVSAHCLCSLGNAANLRMDELGALLGFNHLDATITRTAQLIRDGQRYYPPLRNEE